MQEDIDHKHPGVVCVRKSIDLECVTLSLNLHGWKKDAALLFAYQVLRLPL